MACEPTASDEVLTDAWPELSAAVPRTVEVVVSVKVTEPVAPAGVTVAVKVTDCPNTDGFCEEATVVVVAVPGSPIAKSPKAPVIAVLAPKVVVAVVLVAVLTG